MLLLIVLLSVVNAEKGNYRDHDLLFLQQQYTPSIQYIQDTSSMGQANSSSADEEDKGYTRLTIPWIIDMIDVTDPELMKKITVHPDIDRIHRVARKDKPW